MFDPNKLAAGLRLIAEAFETQEVQEPQTPQTDEPQAEEPPTDNVVNMYGSPVPEAPLAQQKTQTIEEGFQSSSPRPDPQVSREALMAKLQDLAQTKSNEAVVALIKTVAPGGRFSEVPEALYGTLYQQAQDLLRGGAA